MKSDRSVQVKGKEVPVSDILPVHDLIADKTRPPASVTMSVGFSLPYGEAKVSCSITLLCDQEISAIAEAQRMAFELAKKYADDGMAVAYATLQEKR